MRLRLNLDDVDVQLKVTGWRPLPDSDDDYYDDWCDVELSLQSKYLNYCPSGELIMHSELEWLRDALKRLLDGTLDKDTHISFAEPDLEFMLHPAKRCYSQPGVVIYRDGYRDFDIDMDFMIRFWCSDGLGSNLFQMSLNRNEITALYIYLCFATKQIEHDSVEIQKLKELGQILPE